MHCTTALWGPVAPHVSTTAVSITEDASCFSGSEDGSITCWQQVPCPDAPGAPNAAAEAAHCASCVQPVAVLQSHAHPVVAVLAGLKEAPGSSSSSSDGSRSSSSQSFLLSLDAEGWVALWDCSSWVCLDMTRAAPLPAGATPSLLLMPDQAHVCLVIPATPNLQQEQETTWQQHQRHQQQQQQHSPLPSQQQQQQQQRSSLPATAANLSPMMLVLRWRSLALVAAPLVSNLGLVALTSSSITLDDADAVVAALVLDTAPALAPAAADTVVLCVTRSGWMWGGSLAGNNLGQAWEKPIAQGGSTEPLMQGCISTSQSSSSSSVLARQRSLGSSTAGELQLQLLVVQHSSWRLFVCNSFSSTTGMPQQWLEVAGQQVQLSPVCQAQHREGHSAAAVTGQNNNSSCRGRAEGGGRVRFALTADSAAAPCGSLDDLTENEIESESDSDSESTSCNSNSSSASGAQLQGVDTEALVTKAEGRNQVQRRQRQQHQAAYLLGGVLLQPPGPNSSTLSFHQPVAVVIWNDHGEQQLWSVSCTTHSGNPQQQQPFLQHTPQQQHQVLMHKLQLQPWPWPSRKQTAGTTPAAAGVFAAVDVQQCRYVLLSQQARCHHTDPGSQADIWQGALPFRKQNDWHIHICELAPDVQAADDHHQQQQQQQQECGMEGPRISSVSQQQVLECRLQIAHGRWQAAWSRKAAYTSSSNRSSSGSCYSAHTATDCDVACDDASGAAGSCDDTLSGQHDPALHAPFQHQQQQGLQQSVTDAADCMDTDGDVSSSNNRKRPAADDPAVLAGSGDDAATPAQPGSVCLQTPRLSPAPGLAKQPRMLLNGREGTRQQAAAAQVASALQNQQQQVTHMLLVGSDAPGVNQLAVFLESGHILFYDLLMYCVPGAAWHPDCCQTSTGHIGRVTTTLEVLFKCPPQQLPGCQAAAAAAGPASRLPHVVSWNFSQHGAQADAGADSSTSLPPKVHQEQQQKPQQESLPTQPCVISVEGVGRGWSSRPIQGGVVPLLLTGGHDGSVKAWDLRLQQLGQAWMSVHPHTAPVEAIVLPPVASHLPWSCCVLSMCQTGQVAMSCLASGTVTRTFTGWGLGPPAQLAWSSSRGLLAAGGWDVRGVWQVTVWDTYSGQLDRQLSGAPAHMLMATLAQELTSSMRHLGKAHAHAQTPPSQQQQQQMATATSSSAASSAAAAGVSLLQQPGLIPRNPPAATTGVASTSPVTSGSGSRSSLDNPLAARQPGSVDGSMGTGGGGDAAADAAGVFSPRLQLVTHDSGALRMLPSLRPDVLVIDLDIQQLVADLEAHSKQLQRQSNRQRQHVKQQQAGLFSRRDSTDADGFSSLPPSGPTSRASSFDLGRPFEHSTPAAAAADGYRPSPPPAANTVTSPQQQQQQQLLHACGLPSPGLSVQTSCTAAGHFMTSSSVSPLSHGQLTSPTQQQQQQLPLEQPWWLQLHGRTPPPPAVAAALQAVCLLHRWGLEPTLDEQILMLLGESLWGRPGLGLAQQQLSAALPGSTALKGSATEGLRAAAGAAAAGTAVCGPLQQDQRLHAGQSVAVSGPAHPLTLLQMLLQDPLAGGPVLQAAAPCLSQEALLSGNGAAVLGLPAVPWPTALQEQQQQQHDEQDDEQQPDKLQGGKAAACCALPQPGVLLSSVPSLLASKLLALAGVSKWLMATIPTPTSINACSGLVTMYALHLPELLAQATAERFPSKLQKASPQSRLAQAGPSSPTAHTTGRGRTSPAKVKVQKQQHPARPLVPDLLLIASTSLACPGLLAEAAQLLMAALLHPAHPGAFAVPFLTQLTQQQQQQQQQLPEQQQQQQQQLVFTSPGAAAAASCWPPAVLQLAVLQQQQHQGQQQQHPALPLTQLPFWLPQLVLSAAAAFGHAAEMPPELLAAVSAGLIDVLLGTAPASSSCVAAGWLCQVLRSGYWSLWRPYVGKPAHLIHRMCYLIDRLQASSTDSRSAATSLVQQSIANSPLTGTAFSPDGSLNSSSSSSDFRILAEQPYALADPWGPPGSLGITRSTSSMGGCSQQKQQTLQHIEGGLFISDALLGTGGSPGYQSRPGSRQGSLPTSSWGPAHTAGTNNSLAVAPTAAAGSVGSSNWPAGGAVGPAHHATTATGIRYSYTSQHHDAAGVHATTTTPMQDNPAGSQTGLPGRAQQQQQQWGLMQQLTPAAAVRVSRSLLVVWLRSALDLLAALIQVDPPAVLMELSSKLAAPAADTCSSSSALIMSALSRVLRRPNERMLLLPHLGFIAALATQALDPGRAQLRQAMLQPVMSVVREMSAHFPQVDCHSSSLQLAVGSTRPLAGQHSTTGAAAHAAGIAPVVHAPTVAVFDMNGGLKKKVLLLPIAANNLEKQQQQQQHEVQHAHHAPAGPTASVHRVGPFGSTNSLASNGSTESQASAITPAVIPHLPAGIPALWSAAEGLLPGSSAAEQQAAAGVRRSSGWGGSSSSLSSSTAAGDDAGVGSSRCSSSNRLAEVQRSTLGSNTMTRAEAAMVEGWFGGGGDSSGGDSSSSVTAAIATVQGSGSGSGSSQSPDGPGPAAAAARGAVGSPEAPGSTHQNGGSIAAAGTQVGGSAAGCGGLSAAGTTNLLQGGLWYPDGTAAGTPMLGADDVCGGVAAVAFNPGGDAVAAFVLGCHCLVVWKLQSSWTQKLATFGSSKPLSHLPHAYIRLPAAALLVNTVFQAEAGGNARPPAAKQWQQQASNTPRAQGTGSNPVSPRPQAPLQQQQQDGGGGGGSCNELLQWQLRWQADSHIDLLCQGCLCGSVEVRM